MSAVNAGRAEVSVELRDRIAERLPALKRKLKATGASIAKLGATVGAAAGAGLGLFSAAAKSFASAGTELVNLSVKTGASVQTLSALEFAAARTGSSMTDVQEILQKIKDGKALELWGSKSAGVLRLLKSDLGGLMREAKQMGLVMSNMDASAAVQLTSALTTSALMLKSLWNAVGAAVAPAVMGTVEQLTKFVQPMVAFIKNNKEIVRVLFATISVVSIVGTALAGLGGIVAGAGAALGFLSGAFVPLLAGAGILLAVGVAAYKFRDQLMEAWRSVSQSIAPVIDGLRQLYGVFSETFGGILMALGSGQLQAAANIAWLGMVAAAWTGVEQIADAVDTTIDYLETWFPALDSVGEYFTETFGAIVKSILAGRWDLAGQLASKQLSLGWQSGLDFMRDGVDQWTVWIGNAFQSTVDYIYDLLSGIGQFMSQIIAQGLETVGLLPEGAAAAAQKAIDEANKKKDAQRKARPDLNEQVAFETGQRERERTALAAEIRELEQQAEQAFAGAGRPTVGRVARQARDDLSAAIAQARKEMERLGQDAPKLDFDMAKSKTRDDKSESRGTFSAVAAALFGAGDNSQKETARNTATMTRQLKRIADQQQAAGDAI